MPRKKKEETDMDVTRPKDSWQAGTFIFTGVMFFLTEKPLKTLIVTACLIGLLAIIGSLLGLDQYTKVKVEEVTGQKVVTGIAPTTLEQDWNEMKFVLVQEQKAIGENEIVVNGYRYGRIYDKRFAAFVLRDGSGLFIVDILTHRGYPIGIPLSSLIQDAKKK